MSFTVYHRSGSIAELHGDTFLLAERSAYVLAPHQACAALGSTQSESVLNREAVALAGREVVRRRSGGGLVVMDPSEILWIDVVISANDPLWSADVGEAFAWLGDVWIDALAEVGETPASGVFQRFVGPLAHRDLGKIVCFAGAGSGEVMDGRRKVVGMSQRRTREFARFQCLVHAAFRPDDSVSLLTEEALRSAGTDAAAMRQHLSEVVGTVGDLSALRSAFLHHLSLM